MLFSTLQCRVAFFEYFLLSFQSSPSTDPQELFLLPQFFQVALENISSFSKPSLPLKEEKGKNKRGVLRKKEKWRYEYTINKILMERDTSQETTHIKINLSYQLLHTSLLLRSRGQFSVVKKVLDFSN